MATKDFLSNLLLLLEGYAWMDGAWDTDLLGVDGDEAEKASSVYIRRECQLFAWLDREEVESMHCLNRITTLGNKPEGSVLNVVVANEVSAPLPLIHLDFLFASNSAKRDSFS